MTEKIIIDGVNVAECPNYYKKDGSCMSGDCDCTLCIHNDCCYKQLKRLEQERDEWKKKYEDAANENLKEIYELIKKNDCWRGVVNVVCSKLEQENKDLKKEIAELRKDCNHCNFHNYSSALEEIRILATKNVSIENFVKIQNKINEVLKNEV